MNRERLFLLYSYGRLTFENLLKILRRYRNVKP